MKKVLRRTKPLRTLAEPFVVAPPTGQRITTRLHLSAEEELVLVEVGCLLTSLANKDLKDRVALGGGYKHLGRKERKRGLTAATSARWAGSITRASDDQYSLAVRGLYDNRTSKIRAIKAIEERLAIPTGTSAEVGTGKDKKTVKGYPNQHVRWLKQQRLAHLLSELTKIEQDIASGRPSIVRGSKRLLSARHHLEEAGLSVAQWQSKWSAARLFIQADGEADKLWGNETIRVNGNTGVLTIRLPSALARLSNTPDRAPTYAFLTQVKFSYHEEAWLDQVTGGAVSYSISRDPVKNRWYLSVSWTTAPVPTPSLAALRAGRSLGVDLNADHLACWVINQNGSPVGEAIRIDLDQSGSTALRDGHLRQAISELLHVAKKTGCTSITVENLNFSDARCTGRETMGRGPKGKSFRRIVSGIPTARFRDRLSGMAANYAISIIAVDPAYTSQWGLGWVKPLTKQSRENEAITTHACASVVIGRRGKQHKARNHASSSPVGHQRMTNGQSTPAPGLVVIPAVSITVTSKVAEHSAKTQLSELVRDVGADSKGAKDRWSHPVSVIVH